MKDLKGIIEDVEKSSLVSDKVIKKVIEILGQENWNYINDEESDICTTAGELIITLKGIPELEKENADLRDNYDQFKAIAEPEIERLKKENAELKAELTKKADTNHSLVEQMADLESKNAELKEKLENERHSPEEHIDKDKVVLGIIKHCNKTRYSLVQWNGEWWYQYGTFNAEVRLIAWYNIPELPKESE